MNDKNDFFMFKLYTNFVKDSDNVEFVVNFC